MRLEIYIFMNDRSSISQVVAYDAADPFKRPRHGIDIDSQKKLLDEMLAAYDEMEKRQLEDLQTSKSSGNRNRREERYLKSRQAAKDMIDELKKEYQKAFMDALCNERFVIV